MISEIALALVLLTSAGRVIKGLHELIQISMGFDPKPSKHAAFSEEVIRRISNLPGVRSAGVTTDLPVSFARTVPFSVEGQSVLRPQDRPQARYYAIGSDYLRAMRIPLVEGREFTSSDTSGAQAVALVNRTLVERFFPPGAGDR